MKNRFLCHVSIFYNIVYIISYHIVLVYGSSNLYIFWIGNFKWLISFYIKTWQYYKMYSFVIVTEVPLRTFVEWYHQFVFTTIISPGPTVVLTSPGQLHQHSGGGLSVQLLKPLICNCIYQYNWKIIQVIFAR